jgi:tetratricopeptide (TPR) repeat protein
MTEIERFTGQLSDAGKFTVAIEFLGEILDLMPEKLDLHKKLAQLYSAAGRPQEGIAHLDILANKLLDEQNPGAAIEVLQTIISFNPPNVTDYRQALAQLQRG